MYYRISGIKLDPEQEIKLLPLKIEKKLGGAFEITDWEIVKESVDARRKNQIKKVYTVDFEVSSETDLEKATGGAVKAAPTLKYIIPKGTPKPLRPIVIGFGPCGMMAAYMLAEAGFSPIILERGSSMEKRVKDVQNFWENGILNTESNVQFGEGGAGTFSDGKLTTGIKDMRIRKVLETFVEAGADPSILYKSKPHIGTDALRKIVVNIRNRIIEMGGEFHFNAKVTDIAEGKVTAMENNIEKTFDADSVVLAIGHSARDTFKMLYDRGFSMEQKPFSIGVRIEHPQKLIDQAQYGDAALAEYLGAADYKLSYRCENGRGAYTFCMCPGGIVVTASSEENMVVTNGMSNAKRNSGTANSALLVDVRTSDFESDHPLAGVEFQRKYERLAFEQGGGRYAPPKTTWSSFEKGDKDAACVISSIPGFAYDSMIEAMPHFAKKIKGFNSHDSVLTAVESRSSSPVRILRGESFEALDKSGVYPGGEGAGYAGGIMSAAVDGIKIAEAIICRED